MRRALSVITVLVVVALSITAMPAMASSHGNVSVASVHDDADGFASGEFTSGLDTDNDDLVFTSPDGSESFGTGQHTWTSPVTGTATFELWGPGGGDGGGSGGGDGGTGGYVMVELDVEKGEEYTIVPGSRGGDGEGQAGMDDGDGGSGGSGLYSGGNGQGSVSNGGGGGGGGDSGILDPDGNEVASAGGGGGGGGDDGGWGGGGAQGGSGGLGAQDGDGPGSHGGDGGGSNSDGTNAGYSVSQGTEISGSTGGGNDGSGEIQVQYELEPGHTETYTSATHNVTDPIDGFAEFDTLNDIEATVTWEEYNGDSWSEITSQSYTTTGNHSQDISSASSEQIRSVIEFEVTGSNPEATLTQEGVTAETYDPELSDPSPVDEFIDERPIILEINVTDEDFDLAHGDEVTVTFYNEDDEAIGQDTLTSNGTATAEFTEPLGGDNPWYAVAEDAYGGEDRSPETGTHAFQTPGEIEIRDEETLELLDGEDVDVEVRFFQEDEETVYTRQAENGVVDMEGLPADVEFVAAASTEDYHDRRIIIPDLFEQQTIYLLNESADTVQIDFQLEDRTRDFDPENTKLRIMRAVGEEGEDQTYEVIAGDYFGATGSFPVDLAHDDRYRLEIENREGQSRTLGSFTPVVSQVETLEVGTVTVGAQVDSGYVFDTRTYTEAVDDETDVEILEVGYVDREGLTESVEWELRYQSNETVVHGPVTWTWGSDADQTAEELLTEGVDYPADAQLEIAVTIERDGETHERIVPVGGLSPLDWPVNAKWLAWFGFFTLVGVAALFGGTMSRTGAVIVVFVAFGLAMLGVIALSPLVLSFALVAAIMFKVAERGGP